MPVQTPLGRGIRPDPRRRHHALQIGKAAIAVPILQRELALTLVTASWVVGAYGVLGAIAGLPAGILTSLFSARATLIAGLVIAGVGSLAGAFAESGTMLIATRVLEGCGSLAAALAVPRLLRAVTAPKDLDAGAGGVCRASAVRLGRHDARGRRTRWRSAGRRSGSSTARSCSATPAGGRTLADRRSAGRRTPRRRRC